MWHNYLLYFVFLVQVLVLSYYFPRRLVTQMLKVMDDHPIEEYPKLYPVSKDALMIGVNTFRYLNTGILIIGLAIVVHAVITSAEELLFADSSAVILGFFFLQYVPLLILEISSYKYMKLMRSANQVTKRTANLKPRKVFDYFPPVYLWITLVMHLFFIGLIYYISQDPFEGFGGYSNLLGVLFTDALFLGILLWNIYGKRKDPYQDAADRAQIVRKAAKAMFLTINLVILFISLNILTRAFDARYLIDLFLSGYFIVISIVSLQSIIIDPSKINFDVYRKDSQPS